MLALVNGEETVVIKDLAVRISHPEIVPEHPVQRGNQWRGEWI